MVSRERIRAPPGRLAQGEQRTAFASARNPHTMTIKDLLKIKTETKE
jgi:hypothetical protein